MKRNKTRKAAEKRLDRAAARLWRQFRAFVEGLGALTRNQRRALSRRMSRQGVGFAMWAEKDKEVTIQIGVTPRAEVAENMRWT